MQICLYARLPLYSPIVLSTSRLITPNLSILNSLSLCFFCITTKYQLYQPLDHTHRSDYSLQYEGQRRALEALRQSRIYLIIREVSYIFIRRMEPSVYNFEKRNKSDKLPRSLDLAAKITSGIIGNASQSVAIPNNQPIANSPTAENKKAIAGSVKTRVSHYSLNKPKISQSQNISQLGNSVEDTAAERQERGTKIVNMKLQMASPKMKSPSKARSRFVARQKINPREIVLMCSGPQRKTLMDYIRNKQDSNTDRDKDPPNKYLKLQPIKKRDDEFIKSINRKLLHIQRMRPGLRTRDREMEEKRMQGYIDSKLPQTLAMTKEQPEEMQMKTESVQMMTKQRSQTKIKQTPVLRKFEPEVCVEYALSKKGFVGRRDFFVFGLGDRPQDSMNKIDMYRDFLWKINFTNGLFVQPDTEIERSYRVYIGKGNNSMLIRGLMKRRFWWTVVDNLEDVHFSWSQLKNSELIKQQKPSAATVMSNSFSALNSSSIIQQIFTPREEASSHLKKRARKSKKRHKSNSDSETQISAVGKHQVSQKAEKYLQLQSKDPHSRIFCEKQMILWSKHMELYSKIEAGLDQKTYLKRTWLLKFKQATKIQSSQSLLVTNHLISNNFIGNKKAMFYSMRKYYQLRKQNVFSVLPMTFHISKGVEDPQYQKFLNAYQQFQQQKQKDRTVRNIWIAKPGQFTNRGTGITVCASLDDVKLRLRGRQKNSNGSYRTFILQKYIQRPLLYNKRKFDIRHYILITCINGMFKGYWYEEGYLRTSSYQFSTKNYKDPQIHLTNDAIQKHNQAYGKYEKGNKLSYAEFQKYLDATYKGKYYDFFNGMLPRMKAIAANAIKASYFLLDTERKHHNFEIFGLDFMIDEQFNPWLIQINTNPCLELGCPLLARLIPAMVENALKIGLDPLFPPPYMWQIGRKYQLGDDPLNNNRFQVIFDQSTQGAALQELYKNVERIDRNMGEIEEEDEEFDQQTGKEWDGQL